MVLGVRKEIQVMNSYLQLLLLMAKWMLARRLLDVAIADLLAYLKFGTSRCRDEILII